MKHPRPRTQACRKTRPEGIPDRAPNTFSIAEADSNTRDPHFYREVGSAPVFAGIAGGAAAAPAFQPEKGRSRPRATA